LGDRAVLTIELTGVADEDVAAVGNYVVTLDAGSKHQVLLASPYLGDTLSFRFNGRWGDINFLDDEVCVTVTPVDWSGAVGESHDVGCVVAESP
jgi:hypothetical protein